MSRTVSLLFLIFISGVVAQDGWAVNYNSKSVCALKGSALTMECTYTPPSGHSVQKAFWTKELVTSGSEPPDLLNDTEYRGRVLYLGDEHSDCTLRFKTVREKDQRKYYFTFITDQPGGKYQGEGGVDLSVTDLQVEVPERVIEGDKVTLTFKTTCSLTVRPTITWYRNGHRLSSRTDQLHLQPVSREDAGRYHCAVLGQNSPEVTLNVRYGPKSVSVSISPSGEIAEGSSVTLTCSSDANPPVQNYTWFKEGGSSPVGSGHSYRALQSGFYYCVALNEHGSQKSAAVTVSVKVRSIASDAAPDPDLSNQYDVHYACIVLQRVRNPRNAESSAVTASGTEEEVQYASIQHRRDKVIKKTEEDEVQYTSADLLISLRRSLTVSLLVLIFISDLQVEVPERVMEGDNVTFTCKTTCNLTIRPTFTWYRNGHRLSSSTDQLHLQLVSREDAGRYHCAVLGQNLCSPEITLNVRCDGHQTPTINQGNAEHLGKP
ncbi:hypothetical protein MHYP_G00100140 [Metynnis hypsauchen]